jgi:hypothetical protein
MTYSNSFLSGMAKSAFSFCILFLLTITVKAQWTGTGPVYTDDPVQIEQVINGGGLPGLPQPPLLKIFTTDYSVGPVQTSNHLFVGSNGNIGLGTATPLAKLHLWNGNFKITSAVNGDMFNMRSNGEFNMRTNGAASIGLTINNQTDDFFKVNPISLNYGITNTLSFDNTGDFQITNSTANTSFRIDPTGNVSIQNGNNIEFKIFNDGSVIAREVKVNLNTIPPDYVFEKEYPLMSINDLEAYVNEHKHLPNIPSAKEMEKDGNISVGDMQFKLLEKVEELSLYIIELKKENEQMKSRLAKLEN